MIMADANKDGKISQEELKAFLDEKCAFYNDAFDDLEAVKRASGAQNSSEIGQPHDRAKQPSGFSQQIFKILFDKLQANNDGKISIEEFVKTYLEGEYRLLERSKQTIQILSQKVQNRELIFKQLVDLKKLKQANQVKSMNRYGIQDDSTLKVDVN